MKMCFIQKYGVTNRFVTYKARLSYILYQYNSYTRWKTYKKVYSFYILWPSGHHTYKNIQSNRIVHLSTNPTYLYTNNVDMHFWNKMWMIYRVHQRNNETGYMSFALKKVRNILRRRAFCTWFWSLYPVFSSRYRLWRVHIACKPS